MDKIKILWVDDEIDLLKPQLMYLKKKAYEVHTVTNGYDAIAYLKESGGVDLVFLDESMPGMTGLETLEEIKKFLPHCPVVMITKNEEEHIMDEAIGARIADYLIKPVNPNQILLTIKRLIDNKRLVRQKALTDYQQEFQQILSDIGDKPNAEEWVAIYKRLINWELKLDASGSDQMGQILAMQKAEANASFSKFIERNYQAWHKDGDAPILSHQLLRKKLFPRLLDDRPTLFLLLDNLRYDQWMSIYPIINELYKLTREDFFYSILPTTTQYSRNAIFSGMMPRDIAKHYPEWWFHDHEEGGKNNHEKDLLELQIKHALRKQIKWDYLKITKVHQAKQLQDRIADLMHNDLTVVVYNFIDMLSHARTEMEVLKELAGDEKAYRSLTKSWFVHSPLWQALQIVAEKNIRLVITTDHGTIRVHQASKVVGDRDTTTNLRYKHGRNLRFDAKDVLHVQDPSSVGLPSPHISSGYIFAKGDSFFLYPNNYNYYHNLYKNTFQHGGISLEEVICPYVELEAR